VLTTTLCCSWHQTKLASCAGLQTAPAASKQSRSNKDLCGRQPHTNTQGNHHLGIKKMQASHSLVQTGLQPWNAGPNGLLVF
jgi:hypothetical protein